MNCAFLFPGQGSQKIGMGADLVAAYPVAKLRFNEANAILGRDIASICFNGPQEVLTATENTQPALFTTEAALCDILTEIRVVPSITLGHSLGEYAALYAAGVISFADGLTIVAKRGALMATAGQKKPGTMAAVMGLTIDQIRTCLTQVKSGMVVAANENSSDQTVISGEINAVQEACELLKTAGAKRTIALPVSGAFHSPLMQSVADEFALFLDQFNFMQPCCPVITNVTAKPETDPAVIKGNLVKQMVNPVRWVDSMNELIHQATNCLEVGPGSVLQGLAKKSNAMFNVVSCATAENIAALASAH